MVLHDIRATGTAKSPDCHREKLRVLVVDDSRTFRMLIAGWLAQVGHHVDEAADGANAQRVVQANEYDVVVTDLTMPGVDGYGVIETARSRAHAPEVILLTGTHDDDAQAAIRALRLGAHDFLTKPLSRPEEVLLSVERAGEKRRLREANARLMRELEALTRADALTGALNRRAFDESLAQEAARARRYGHALSLVLMDLDGFKAVNDEHGHPAGDEALRDFTERARTELREADALFRLGGDEFALLLPHTDTAGALAAATRVVQLTAATPLRAGGRTVALTCSAGLASHKGKLARPDRLTSEADQALYGAKRAGRNRALAFGDGRPA
jgi:diguanylate cyclase (GGDEF)-like protein